MEAVNIFAKRGLELFNGLCRAGFLKAPDGKTCLALYGHGCWQIVWQTMQPNYLTLAQEYYSVLIPALMLILIFCIIKSSLTFRDANCLFFFFPPLSLWWVCAPHYKLNSTGLPSLMIQTVGDLDSVPGSGRFPRRKAWQPTPVFLPGESHGQEEPGGL